MRIGGVLFGPDLEIDLNNYSGDYNELVKELVKTTMRLEMRKAKAISRHVQGLGGRFNYQKNAEDTHILWSFGLSVRDLSLEVRDVLEKEIEETKNA